jgi:hypothetical protein
VRKDKEGTARVVAWNFGVKYSYTLEASLGGTTMDGKVRRLLRAGTDIII